MKDFRVHCPVKNATVTEFPSSVSFWQLRTFVWSAATRSLWLSVLQRKLGSGNSIASKSLRLKNNDDQKDMFLLVAAVRATFRLSAVRGVLVWPRVF